MLKKLLKYDLKFIFKYWWIAAVVCGILSVVCGFCVTFLLSDRELPSVVTSTATSALFLTYITFFGVGIVTFILIFIRFYCNFFSDEGYLTFTLPVKRSSLLNSKIISAFIVSVATAILLVICVCAVLMIGLGKDFWDKEFWYWIFKGLKMYFGSNIICRIIYIIEILASSVLSTIFGYLFLYTCISIASIIAKKARVIIAIGLYFGINFTISFILQIFFIFGIGTIINYFQKIEAALLEPTICLAGLGVVLFLAAVCSALYVILYRMLDRKLNLT